MKIKHQFRYYQNVKQNWIVERYYEESNTWKYDGEFGWEAAAINYIY